jgi:dihydroneopterin triphosphate diphosphatase
MVLSFLLCWAIMQSPIQLVDVYPYRYFEEQLQFLLLKRAPGRIYEGQWRMVGGKVGSGERRDKAALRELREELGAEPARFWAVPAVNHFYDAQSDEFRLVAAFAAELSERCTIALNHEHDDFRWVSEEDAEKMVIWPEQIKMIGYISAILEKNEIPDVWIVRNQDQQR